MRLPIARSTPVWPAGPLAAVGVLLAGALGLAGCGGDEPLEVPEARRGPPRLEAPAPGASDLVRLGLVRPDAGPPRFDLDLPEGWVRREPSSMRLVNLGLAAHPEVECYLTALAAAGNTLLGNLNRWRRQMGADPVEADALAALPRHGLLGQEAVFVELAGTYSDAMSGAEPRPDQALLGLLAVMDRTFVTFKMTGPRAVVEGERERFLAVAASLKARFRDTPAPADAPAPAPAAPPGPQPEVERGTLRWTAPSGWTSMGASGMREVTFRIGEDGTECWITFLGPAAGGVEANVNRWRGEMGQPPLGPAELDALPRLDVLGVKGVLVAVEGEWQGMGKPPLAQAGLLGLVAELPDRTLFVKLVGPAEAVRAQREPFEAFCRSLEPRS